MSSFFEAKAAWSLEFEADALAAQSECRFLQAKRVLSNALLSEESSVILSETKTKTKQKKTHVARMLLGGGYRK